jgi:hypothetical protein
MGLGPGVRGIFHKGGTLHVARNRYNIQSARLRGDPSTTLVNTCHGRMSLKLNKARNVPGHQTNQP